MRLTLALNSPPIFRYWKHFGAGLQKRQPNFKHWRHALIAHFERRQIPDHTLPEDRLPPGARVLDAEDLLRGHIDEMPDQLLKRKEAVPVLYDHPWPHNVQLDPIDSQDPILCYNINTRLFKPLIDGQVLTNSVIETDSLEAHPPMEPSGEHIEGIGRQVDWAKKGDSVLTRMPKDKSDIWPKLNRGVRRKYGLSKERVELNVMNALNSYSQALLAKYYHEQANQAKLDDILGHRSLNFPHCVAPFERGEEGAKINLDLFIDSMTIGRQPMPQLNSTPEDTRQHEFPDIRPRTWRSVLEKTRSYSPAWSFTLPRNAHLHTIQLASRIMRKHRGEDEMLARLIVHAFGLTSQFARLREVSNENLANGNATNDQATCILQDPLDLKRVNQLELLPQPIVLQTIGYDHHMGHFRFMRYQLNTLNFDDRNSSRVKNQVWHSGPISDLDQVLRYYLDFQSFDSTQVDRMLADAAEARRIKKAAEQTDFTRKSAMEPKKLSEDY